MTKLAKEKAFGPIIGRQNELNRLIQILHNKRSANAVIVGHPGVGKTALVEALAIAIAKNKVPPSLKDASLWALDLPGMIAGAQYRGELEQRLKEILDWIVENPNVIIFIDEIHMISGSGHNDKAGADVANVLKPYLAGSSVRCIGATTYDDYRNSFSKDTALSRRFKRIDLSEVDSNETLAILKGIKSSYEKFHKVHFSDQILQEIIDLSGQYINNLYFPDKAIEIMDELGSMYKSQLKKGNNVTSLDVEELIAKMANISSIKAKDNDKAILKTLKDNIIANLYGQEEIVDKVVNHIKLARAGLTAKNRPLGVFGFLGKSGTGKTELAKQIANALGISFIRLDMSEYSEEITISKLLGGAPGYVGFDQPGSLTEPVLQNPHCVLLLDEIEKAHRKVYEILLPIMDEGQISDNKNRLVSFRNTIIILTGNVGSARAEVSGEYIGFASSNKTNDILQEELKRSFAPEFRNRFTDIFQFNDLGKEELSKIVDKEIRRQNSNLAEKKITLAISSNATNFIVDQAKKENMGGRPIERIVNKIVANELVDMILFDNLSNCNVLLELVDNQVKAIKQDSLAKKSTNPKRKTTKKAPKKKEALKQLQLDLSLDNQEEVNF
jgi:ATP-dependent Clp protease ATP-binding subunit ClpA